jgi:hypothetical protein
MDVKSSKLVEGIHYTINEDGRVVFTALYLIQQQKCCGNGCVNCVYSPKHQKNNTKIHNDFEYLIYLYEDKVNNVPKK